MSERNLEELLAAIARALGATSARVLHLDEAGEDPASDPRTLWHRLPGDRALVVDLPEAPADRLPLQVRLDTLAEGVADLLRETKRPRRTAAATTRTLQEELASLVATAGAVDAVVIDARSPVVWASATEVPAVAARVEVLRPAPAKGLARIHAVGPEGVASGQGVRPDPLAMAVVPRSVCARHRVLPVAMDGDKIVVAMMDPDVEGAIYDIVLATGLEVDPVLAGESMAAFFDHLEGAQNADHADEALAAIPPEERAVREPRARAAEAAWGRVKRTRRAIEEVRALPELPTLPRGGHLRAMRSDDAFGFVARSFGGIYVLVLVFAGPFEELAVKRALARTLPAVERLVVALPPLDPTPTKGAAAMRRPRRR